MAVKIMSAVWEHAPVRGGELLVLLALADHANDSGTCFPSVPRLAQRARLSVRQTQRVLRHLESIGLVSRQHHAGRAGTDLFTVHTPDILTPPPPTPMTPGGDTHDAKGVTPMSPRTVKEPSRNRQAAALRWSVEEGWQNIPADLRASWQTSFPGVFLERELAKADAWLRANPKRRKRAWAAFIWNWLSRSEPSESPESAAAPPPPPEPDPAGWLEALRGLFPGCWEPPTFAELKRQHPEIAGQVLEALSSTTTKETA